MTNDFSGAAWLVRRRHSMVNRALQGSCFKSHFVAETKSYSAMSRQIFNMSQQSIVADAALLDGAELPTSREGCSLQAGWDNAFHGREASSNLVVGSIVAPD